MRALIVSAVFPPEPVTSAVTSEQLALGLIDAGHKVTVIAPFPSRPAGRLYPGYRRALRHTEQRPEGYRLIRCFSVLSPRPSLRGRFLENVSFGLTSTLNALLARTDVVYSNSWPIIASGLIAGLCAVRRIPLVVSVQDIHPEAAIGVGKLNSDGPSTRLLKCLDRLVAHRATMLVAVSENFADFYRSVRQVPADKIQVVYNWMDDDEIRPGPRAGHFRQMLGIPEDIFVVMYAGNIGANAGVECLIEAAHRLHDVEKLVVYVVGDGSSRADCEGLTKRLELANVRFFYPWHRDEVSMVHAAADVLVLPTRRSGAMTSVPSKLIAYMLSGRPVLAAVAPDSDTARIIRSAGCGVCIEPENPVVMAQAIRGLLQRPHDLVAMGERGRRYAEEHFSRRVCVPQLVRILEAAAQTKRSAERGVLGRLFSS